jgi:hypothetical protein
MKITIVNTNEIFTIPLNFTGSTKWLRTDVIPLDPNLKDPLNKKYTVEKNQKEKNISDLWKPIWRDENNLDIEPHFNGNPGILYLKHFLWCPDKRKVRIGVPTNQFMKLWLNNKKVHQTKKRRR